MTSLCMGARRSALQLSPMFLARHSRQTLGPLLSSPDLALFQEARRAETVAL